MKKSCQLWLSIYSQGQDRSKDNRQAHTVRMQNHGIGYISKYTFEKHRHSYDKANHYTRDL